MDFSTKTSLGIISALMFIIASCKASCAIEKTTNKCVFIVKCVNRPGTVTFQPCSSEIVVTYVLTATGVNIVSSSLFTSTNFDSKVRNITALQNYWRSIEPHAFKYYTKTVNMNLTDNGIETISKEAFSELIKLVSLDLSHNNIVTLGQHSLYISPGNSLKFLDLSFNKLLSLQNDVFSYVPNLIKLNLRNNKLVSLEDDCFANLKDLTELYLQNNFLIGLNATLGPLRGLQILDLSRNELKKIAGYEMMRLTTLENLNVSNNMIEVVEDTCFAQMLKLKYLDLAHNKIYSIIQPSMFENNRVLEYINLFDNNITTIKELSFGFNALKYINFEQNNLSGEITREALNGLSNVSELSLTQQHITAIRKRAFVDMYNLKYLNLSRNAIQMVDNSSFQFYNKSILTSLDLSFNLLSDIDFMTHFTSNLTELYLNNNKLTVLKRNLFINHTNIKYLTVSENEIYIVEQHALPLRSLLYLKINRNALNGTISKNVLSPAPFITDLNLSDLKIKLIDESAFEDLPLLKTLNLSNNEVQFIHSNNFKNMNGMKTLDVSYNKLAEFDISTNLDKVNTICLKGNKFTRLPKLLLNISEVSFIDVSYNAISNTDNAGFENVRTLIMTNNNITVFNNEQTNKLTKLVNLMLNSNSITEINLAYFKNLFNADLSNNSICCINSTMFENLRSLQYLNLSMNKINDILPGSFQHLPILNLLNLSSNYIKNLRYGTFRGLVNAQIIDLSWNKIGYVDIEVFHECVGLRKLILDYNLIKTIDVDGLVAFTPNLVSLSIGGNPMSCKEIVRTISTKNSSRFEITSLYEVFHDDNVHGISCGNGNYSSSTNVPHEENTQKNENDDKDKMGKKSKEETEGNSTTNILLLWCLILTILAILGVAYLCYYKRRINKLRRRNPHILQSNSFNVSNVEFNENLLN